MSNDGTFKEHIKHTITTAKDLCSWILRTFNTRDPLPLLTLWKSLVQCKLDYCCQLWSPTEKGDIQDLEMVQRTFLRKLPSLRHLSYWEQLRHLRMYSQERRREKIFDHICLENVRSTGPQHTTGWWQQSQDSGEVAPQTWQRMYHPKSRDQCPAQSKEAPLCKPPSPRTKVI